MHTMCRCVYKHDINNLPPSHAHKNFTEIIWRHACAFASEEFTSHLQKNV